VSSRPRPVRLSGLVTTPTTCQCFGREADEGRDAEGIGAKENEAVAGRVGHDEAGVSVGAMGANLPFDCSRKSLRGFSTRSTKTMPLVWSISCWKTRARKAGGGDADRPAFEVEGLDFNLGVAGDRAVDVFDAQAALELFGGLAFGFDDFGVNEDAKRLVVFVVEIVADDYHAVGFGDLHGGQGGAKFVLAAGFPVEGGGDHGFGECLGLGVDVADTLRPFVEQGLGMVMMSLAVAVIV
jgi:hypothetical protein